MRQPNLKFDCTLTALWIEIVEHCRYYRTLIHNENEQEESNDFMVFFYKMFLLCIKYTVK